MSSTPEDTSDEPSTSPSGESHEPIGFDPDNPESTRVSVPQLSLNSGPGPECLVILYGASIGRKFDLEGPEIFIGREASNHVMLDVDSVSRRHARIDLDNGRRILRDLNSTNGTYVNDQPIETRALASGDLVRVGDVICKYLSGRNVEAAYHEEIYQMTISDGLTTGANVRCLNEFLDREFARSRRHDRNLCVLMLDIDFFKRVNDEYGHLTGDYVLRELAQLLRARVRREELLARYGGEEFCLVLPETTLKGAVQYAESLRASIEEHEFYHEDRLLKVTVSIGVAAYSGEMNAPKDLVKSADEKLYSAKRSGRNRVVA